MIELASLTDLNEVSAVIDAAYSRYVSELGRKPQPMTDDYAALIAANEVFVFRDESAILGVLVLQKIDQDLLVRTVAVMPANQRRGLGIGLMAFAEAFAEKEMIRDIRLYTNEVMTGNAELYCKLGFSESHRTGEPGRQVIYMAKELPPLRTPWFDNIVTDSDICFGKPRIVGTRIYVDLILQLIEGGASIEEVVENHPHITEQQVKSALGFARDLVATKRNKLKSEKGNA